MPDPSRKPTDMSTITEPTPGLLERELEIAQRAMPEWVVAGTLRVVSAMGEVLDDLRYELQSLLASRHAQSDPAARAAANAAVRRAAAGVTTAKASPDELRERWLRDHA